jgi:hypothetical protein
MMVLEGEFASWLHRDDFDGTGQVVYCSNFSQGFSNFTV